MSQIPGEAFRRQNESPNEEFYRVPRLVTHHQRPELQNILNYSSALC